jgi:hypothetical protein
MHWSFLETGPLRFSECVPAPDSQSFAASDMSGISINPLKTETHYKSRPVSQKLHYVSISKVTL